MRPSSPDDLACIAAAYAAQKPSVAKKGCLWLALHPLVIPVLQQRFQHGQHTARLQLADSKAPCASLLAGPVAYSPASQILNDAFVFAVYFLCKQTHMYAKWCT